MVGVGQDTGSLCNESSNATSQDTTLLPLSPPNSRNISHTNRYSVLESEDLCLPDRGEEAVIDEWKAASEMHQRESVKERPKKRSRLSAEARTFTPSKSVEQPLRTSGKSREELIAASQAMQVRKVVSKLRAEAAWFSPSQKEPESAPPISVPTPKQAPLMEVSQELGEYIRADVALLKELGWTKFVQRLRTRSDFASLDDVHHPAKRLLKFYKHRGAPVKLATEPWSASRVQAALRRGPHKSCAEY